MSDPEILQRPWRYTLEELIKTKQAENARRWRVFSKDLYAQNPARRAPYRNQGGTLKRKTLPTSAPGMVRLNRS